MPIEIRSVCNTRRLRSANLKALGFRRKDNCLVKVSCPLSSSLSFFTSLSLSLTLAFSSFHGFKGARLCSTRRDRIAPTAPEDQRFAALLRHCGGPAMATRPREVSDFGYQLTYLPTPQDLEGPAMISGLDVELYTNCIRRC